MSSLIYNKRANFDYDISETYEAGIVLFGHEVKSIKAGQASLRGAFVTLKNAGHKLPEVYLTNAHIPLYKKASIPKNYDPDRPKKLLIKKKEIKHLIGKKNEQGLTLVPIKIYTKHNLVKLEFGIGRGRKKIDKRELIKKREIDKSIKAITKSYTRGK
jgi:SsrA-binding protein